MVKIDKVMASKKSSASKEQKPAEKAEKKPVSRRNMMQERPYFRPKQAASAGDMPDPETPVQTEPADSLLLRFAQLNRRVEALENALKSAGE